MKLLVALLSLCFVMLAPAAVRAEPASQPLSMSLHADGAQATRLPTYDPSIPIAVTVTDRDAQQIQALSVAAAGPAGASVNVSLIRSADGVFSGTLTLPDQGTWRLRLISRSGQLSTGTTPVTLEVAAPPPTTASWIGWAVGLTIFVVVGGGGFFILRRIARLPASIEPAAVAAAPAPSATTGVAQGATVGSASDQGARPTAAA